jgi:rare lipoprotein A (peptidoglycan hydrolase)
MFLSMLLASSVLAAPSPAAAATDTPAAGPVNKLAGPEARRPAGSPRTAKAAKAATHRPAAVAAARRHLQQLAQPHTRTPRTAYAQAAPPAAAPRVARAGFIDDGFTYIEQANGRVIWKQTGVASWYGGHHWQGNLTASGVRYDEKQLTAAHATLPLGSRIRVTLANSERSVIVIINDRPGTRSRIIDLSRGAAAALGILSQGVAVVTLSPV